MFIIARRTNGAIAALLCAALVALLLGGCASAPRGEAAAVAERARGVNADACATAGPAFCMTYGPGRNDRRCTCDQAEKAQRTLESFMLQ